MNCFESFYTLANIRLNGFADLSCLNIIIIFSEIYFPFVDFGLDFRHFFPNSRFWLQLVLKTFFQGTLLILKLLITSVKKLVFTSKPIFP